MELSDKAVRKICSVAQYRSTHGDDSIYCECAKGENAPTAFEFIGIQEGEVCVATRFFSTGHSYSSSMVDLEKMKTCPYRKSSN